MLFMGLLIFSFFRVYTIDRTGHELTNDTVEHEETSKVDEAKVELK